MGRWVREIQAILPWRTGKGILPTWEGFVVLVKLILGFCWCLFFAKIFGLGLCAYFDQLHRLKPIYIEHEGIPPSYGLGYIAGFALGLYLLLKWFAPKKKK